MGLSLAVGRRRIPATARPALARVDFAAGGLAADEVRVIGPLVVGRSGWSTLSFDELCARASKGSLVDAVRGAAGAFVVAVVDVRDGTAALARDATGGRALYVHADASGLVTCSEARAVFAALDRRDVSPSALAAFLSFSYVPGGRSLVSGVRALDAGTVLTWSSASGVSLERHFRVEEPADVAALDARADQDRALHASRVREALFTAVRDALDHTSGPLAALVSGGVDSSAAVAIAHALGERPEVLSLSFGDDLPNELVHSRAVASHLGLRHHVVEVGPDDMARELENAADVLDDPIGEPLTVPNLLVTRAARGLGAARALNGEGGDPCFGGPKNIPMVLSAWYGAGERARDEAYLSAHQKLWDDLPELLQPDVFEAAMGGDEPPWAVVGPYLDDPTQTSLLNKLQRINLEQKGAHLIQPKVEKLYLASGVEPLSPLFDPRVAAAAWATPPRLKLHGNVEKLVLKDAVRDLLPASILERKKSGMLVPVHPWLKGALAPLAGDLLSDASVKRRGFFRPEAVRRLREYAPGPSLRGFHGAKLWLLLSLELFLRRHVDAS